MNLRLCPRDAAEEHFIFANLRGDVINYQSANHSCSYSLSVQGAVTLTNLVGLRNVRRIHFMIMMVNLGRSSSSAVDHGDHD